MSVLSRIVTYAILLLWTVVCLVPVYWVAITSLKSGDNLDKTAGYLPFVDDAPTLESWRSASNP
jgi:multiple sugar transport system permease protein